MPRGYTPLYDAIVLMAATVHESKDKHVIFVVSTDGQENASDENAVSKGGLETVNSTVKAI